MVKKVEIENKYKRIWAIGDIHGHNMSLKSLIQKIDPKPEEDLLVILGDLVDRGPDTKGVFDYLMELERQGIDMIVLRGNHDDMMLRAYHEEINHSGLLKFIKRDQVKKTWLNMGGDKTMQSFLANRMQEIPVEYFDYIEAMPHFAESENFLFVHAGFDFNAKSPFADAEAMMWIRDFSFKPEQSGHKVIIHGHTPLDLEFIEVVAENPKKHHFVPLDNGIAMDKKSNKGNLLGYECFSKKLIVQARQEF